MPTDRPLCISERFSGNTLLAGGNVRSRNFGTDFLRGALTMQCALHLIHRLSEAELSYAGTPGPWSPSILQPRGPFPGTPEPIIFAKDGIDFCLSRPFPSPIWRDRSLGRAGFRAVVTMVWARDEIPRIGDKNAASPTVFLFSPLHVLRGHRPRVMLNMT